MEITIVKTEVGAIGYDNKNTHTHNNENNWNISNHGIRNHIRVRQKIRSDFEILYNSYSNGKVDLEKLTNCELMYVCKTCRNIYDSLDKYTEHYDQCYQQYLDLTQNQPKDSEPSLDLNMFLECQLVAEEETSLLPQPKPKPLPRSQMQIKVIKRNRNPYYSVAFNEEEEKMLNVKKLLCLACNKKFKNERSLRRHAALAHLGYKLYKCKACDFKSNSQPICRQHVSEVHNEPITKENFTSYISHISCKSQSSLKRTRFLEQTNFGSIIKTNNVTIRHINRVRMPRPVKSKVTVLSKQDGQLLNEVDLICLVCNLKFKDKYTLRRHLAISHLGYKRYKCKFCDFQSNCLTDCRDHITVGHKGQIFESNVRKLFNQNFFKVQKY